MENRESGTSTASALRGRSAALPPPVSVDDTGTLPVAAPWSLPTVEAPGLESLVFPPYAPPLDNRSVALLVIGALALTVLPLLFRKARQEWWN